MELTDDGKTPLFFAMQLPSLRELAKMRIARAIWSSGEVISEFHRIQDAYKESTRRHFRPLEKKARGQISHLPLPARLAKEITPLINFVGGVLHCWIDLFERKTEFVGFTGFPSRVKTKPKFFSKFEEWPNRIHLDYIIRNKLRWTAYSTLDYLHMAKSLLRDETIPLQHRFEIGCNFCIEEEIGRLWNELPTVDKIINMRLLNNLLLYWYDTSFRNWNSNTIPKLYSSPFIEFQHPYLWPKLSDQDQKRYLLHFVELAKACPLPNDNFFLFNKMDFEQQRNVLRSNTWEVLKICLSRPWQHLFFDTFNAIKDRLDDHDNDGYGLYDFLRTFTLKQCDNQFRHRFYVEVGPWIRNACHHYYNPRQFTSALVFQVWQGNVDFVRKVAQQEPNLFQLELIMETFHGIENELTENVDEVLDSIKCLIQEWVLTEQWLFLKFRIRRELMGNQLWVDLEGQLKDFLCSLDHIFEEKLRLKRIWYHQLRLNTN